MPSKCDDVQMATTTGGRLARTGRFLRRRRLRVSIAMAAALVTSVLLPAATAQAQAAAPCPSGYLCIYEPDGTIVLVPQGNSQAFPSGVPYIELFNNTNTTDCLILGTVNTMRFSAIGPYTIQYPPSSIPQYVFDVSPGPACPA
jgi:hypothetical protein